MHKISGEEKFREQRGQKVLKLPSMWNFKSPRFWTREVLEKVTECNGKKDFSKPKGEW